MRQRRFMVDVQVFSTTLRNPAFWFSALTVMSTRGIDMMPSMVSVLVRDLSRRLPPCSLNLMALLAALMGKIHIELVGRHVGALG